MSGWLINDKLTCIPNTKTFWHDLLDWIPNLKNKAENIDFSKLANKIENDYNLEKPDYIIRNATFFRRLNLPIKTISLLQDSYIHSDISCQLDVCNNSNITVFNSPFVYEQYKKYIKSKSIIIPLGTDFDFFTPLNKKELKQKYKLTNEPYIIYIGDSSNYPKGFDLLTEIINNTNYNFILIMKDNYKSNNQRVKVFNRIDHNTLRELINCCDLCLCTSQIETLHLAGMECASCNLPIITKNVGIYYNDFENHWGYICNDLNEFIEKIKYTLSNMDKYNSRSAFLDKKADKKNCKNSWINIIGEL